MDAGTPTQMKQAQADQLFQYVLRERPLRDYCKLYPDFQARFGVIVDALPDQVIRDMLNALENAEIPQSGTEHLAAAFALTETESAVALLLLAGHDLADIAGIRQVSRNTVRNQMQSIYDKTATRHQPELIRRLHDVVDQK